MRYDSVQRRETSLDQYLLLSVAACECRSSLLVNARTVVLRQAEQIVVLCQLTCEIEHRGTGHGTTVGR